MVKTTAVATNCDGDGNGRSDANAHSRGHRAVTVLPRPGGEVANVSTDSEGPGTALWDAAGRAAAGTPSHWSGGQTWLGTRSNRDDAAAAWLRRAKGSDRWAAWQQRRITVLQQLAERRYPSYADVAEAFGLAMVAGGPDEPDGWTEHRHARQQTREALEREAARFDRYAARLARDGVALWHPTAMDWLIAELLRLRHAEREVASPGFVLTALTRAAKQLRRDWAARHPDVIERRRAARRARYAELDATMKLQFRVRPGRRWCD